jgi:hypothetical protein
MKKILSMMFVFLLLVNFVSATKPLAEGYGTKEYTEKQISIVEERLLEAEELKEKIEKIEDFSYDMTLKNDQVKSYLKKGKYALELAKDRLEEENYWDASRLVNIAGNDIGIAISGLNSILYMHNEGTITTTLFIPEEGSFVRDEGLPTLFTPEEENPIGIELEEKKFIPTETKKDYEEITIKKDMICVDGECIEISLLKKIIILLKNELSI